MDARQASRAALVLAFSIAILALLGSSAEAAFPGRNGAIVFVRTYPHSNHGDIWKMKRDGGSPQRLSTDSRADLAPAWNPTGTRVVYERLTREFSEDYHYLIVKDADGRPAHVVGVSYLVADATWAPSGPVIVYHDLFVYSIDAAPGVGMLNVRTGTVTPFPSRMASQSQPAWSPDGRRVATIDFHRGPGDLATMNARGRDRTRLTRTPAEEWYPDWSPDSKHIVFTRQYLDDPGDIFMIDVDSGHKTRLTDTRRHEGSAAFSPNGRRIVFDRCCYGEAETSEIFVMHTDGTHVIRLTHNDADDTMPDWQPIPRGR